MGRGEGERRGDVLLLVTEELILDFGEEFSRKGAKTQSENNVKE